MTDIEQRAGPVMTSFTPLPMTLSWARDKGPGVVVMEGGMLVQKIMSRSLSHFSLYSTYLLSERRVRHQACGVPRTL